MKTALFAAGLALLSFASPALASWAESPNMRYPVYTGTDRALARAQSGITRTGTFRFHRHHHRFHRSYDRR